MKAVSLVQLGHGPDLQLPKLVRTLNRLQHAFAFSFEGEISNIGPPTVEAKYYDFKPLFALLSAPHSPKFVIGVTHEHVTDSAATAGSKELDYFSLSDSHQVAVVSTALIAWSSPNRSVEQYLAFLIICEVLNVCAGRDLMHTETFYCLFDDCEDRSVLRHAVERGTICPKSEGELFEAGVDLPTVESAREILKWCNRRPWRSTVTAVITNPLSSLAVGVALGWVSSIYLGRADWQWVVAITMITQLAVLLYERHT